MEPELPVAPFHGEVALALGNLDAPGPHHHLKMVHEALDGAVGRLLGRKGDRAVPGQKSGGCFPIGPLQGLIDLGLVFGQ